MGASVVGRGGTVSRCASLRGVLVTSVSTMECGDDVERALASSRGPVFDTILAILGLFLPCRAVLVVGSTLERGSSRGT